MRQRIFVIAASFRSRTSRLQYTGRGGGLSVPRTGLVISSSIPNDEWTISSFQIALTTASLSAVSWR